MSRASRYLTEECAASSEKNSKLKNKPPHWIWPPAVLDSPKVLLKSVKLHHRHKLGAAEIYGKSPTTVSGPRLSRWVSVVGFTDIKLRNFQPK